ncbi:Integrase core domain protein [Symmachiella macrocystis]|uniref:Integrase core domain protein n=1 Tax=Symmachiella macrocystis TaxID=2527985 RepID=A0A5C6BA95_9PLAN|nr:integrase core domain-containing protein [Symmachiella macrocystis]TWU08637.1 Integrase core domain protein [Symmachiella macrocystis]
MSRLFHPLLLLIANASEHRLAKHVQYLKEELSILRARIPGEIHTKPEERARLLKFGKPLGKDIGRLISIVTPSTFHRWVREERRGHKPAKPGRPRKRQVLRELVRKIARETGVGYTRILGELRRLGINRICRQTVRNILKEEGIDTSPKRSQGSWEQFIKIHAKTLWACDFFTQRIITPRGLVNYFLLVFINVETREIFVTNSTAHPDSAWVTQQARNFLMHTSDYDDKPACLIRDRDTKFTASFDDVFKAEGVKVKVLPVQSPNLNSRCERVIQSIKHECLDNFLVFGEQHLNYLIREYVRYYNDDRAHSACGHLPPSCADPPTENNTIVLNDIVRCERLGGLIQWYERAA